MIGLISWEQRLHDFFAPGLLTLTRADECVPPGGIGRLGEDPLRECQDDGGFRLSSVAVDRPSGRRAEVTVHATIGTAALVVGLDLIKTERGWRIAVVRNRSIPSLIAFLSDAGSPPPG